MALKLLTVQSWENDRTQMRRAIEWLVSFQQRGVWTQMVQSELKRTSTKYDRTSEKLNSFTDSLLNQITEKMLFSCSWFFNSRNAKYGQDCEGILSERTMEFKIPLRR